MPLEEVGFRRDHVLFENDLTFTVSCDGDLAFLINSEGDLLGPCRIRCVIVGFRELISGLT